MKLKKEELVVTINVLIALLIGSFIWRYIELDFSNPNIVGEYSENEYNSLNDIVRYIVFVALPVFIYLFSKFYFDKNFILKTKFFLISKNPHTYKADKFLNILAYVMMMILFLEYLSTDFPIFKIDSYHDGQRLSSAYKNYLDGSLWSGSYITVGIFYETLSSSLTWQLFDHVSIGLARYAEIFYIFILKILLIILSLLITKLTTLTSNYKYLFFIINSLVLVSLSDYNTASVDLITFREIPTIILLILFILSILKNNNFFILFLISSVSLLSMLWGIDRGLVCNLLIFIILLDLIFQKEYKKTIYLIFFIFLFWFVFYQFNSTEFKFFVENTLSIFKEMNYIFGIIHPIPFTGEPNSARATKSLILIILSILLSLNLIFREKDDISKNLAKAFIFLSIIGVGSYLYALGRTDGPHIRQVFGYQIMFIIFYISLILLLKLNNKDFRYENYIKLILFFLVIIFSFQSFNFSKILNYKNRFNSYIYLPDSFFLSEKENLSLNELRSINEIDNCVQLFTYDAALLYLLRKPSCTKYYYIYSVGSLSNQKKLIKEIEKTTNYIILRGETDSWDHIEEKYNLVNSYILENFYFYKDAGYRKVMKIKLFQ